MGVRRCEHAAGSSRRYAGLEPDEEPGRGRLAGMGLTCTQQGKRSQRQSETSRKHAATSPNLFSPRRGDGAAATREIGAPDGLWTPRTRDFVYWADKFDGSPATALSLTRSAVAADREEQPAAASQ